MTCLSSISSSAALMLVHPLRPGLAHTALHIIIVTLCNLPPPLLYCHAVRLSEKPCASGVNWHPWDMGYWIWDIDIDKLILDIDMGYGISIWEMTVSILSSWISIWDILSLWPYPSKEAEESAGVAALGVVVVGVVVVGVVDGGGGIPGGGGRGGRGIPPRRSAARSNWNQSLEAVHHMLASSAATRRFRQGFQLAPSYRSDAERCVRPDALPPQVSSGLASPYSASAAKSGSHLSQKHVAAPQQDAGL